MSLLEQLREEEMELTWVPPETLTCLVSFYLEIGKSNKSMFIIVLLHSRQ